MSAVPRATIGMPVYNGEKFVQRSVESLLAQQFEDFELVISDNASTDGTWDILQGYASRDPRIVLHRQKSNFGATRNFDYVLSEAKSRYFMWAGCDDWWRPDHLGNLVAELDAHSDAAAAMSATARYSETGEPLDTIRYDPIDNPNRLTKLGFAMRIAGGKLYHFYIYGLYRTAFLRAAFLDVPSVKAADRLFVCQLALSSRVRYVDEPTYMRQTFDANAGERYQDGGDVRALIYSDSLAYWKTVAAMGPYLFASKVIPAAQKCWIPLLVARSAVWLAGLSIRTSTRQALYSFLGKERATRFISFLRHSWSGK